MARSVAVALESMGFEIDFDERDASATSIGAVPPGAVAVRVPAGDWAELAAVLPEVVHEQAEFDSFIESWHARARTRQRVFLIAVTLIVGLLAMLGVIEL
jgi:hypothetical protein